MMLLVHLFILVVFSWPASSDSVNLTETQRHVKGYILNIERNVLTYVVKTAESTETLDLSGLKLVGIERKAFNNLDNVKNLTLADNHLTSLSQLLFVDLKNLEYLYLGNNPFAWNINFLVGLEKLKIFDVSNINEKYWNKASYFGIPRTAEVRYDRRRLIVPDNSYHNESRPYILLCVSQGIVKSVGIAEDIQILRTKAMDCDRADLLDYTTIAELNLLQVWKCNIIGFRRNWYRLKKHFIIDTVDFSLNKIRRVSGIMLNDLPATVTHVTLNNNHILKLERGQIDNSNIQYLRLRHNFIHDIDQNALLNTGIYTLELFGNRLSSNKFLETVPATLTYLDLGQNIISKLTPNAFSKLKILSQLNLEKNLLASLETNVFNGLEGVRDLTLSSNKLRNISSASFLGLSKNLNTLLLDDNEIEIIRRGTFNGAPTSFLDLSNNKINHIEDGAFNLPLLQTLMLSNNMLPVLQNGVKAGIPRANIHMDGN